MANTATMTPKVTADEYWKGMSTDVETELAIINSASWATDLEESLNNSLGIIQEGKEEEAASWQDRWANRRRKLLYFPLPLPTFGRHTNTI